MAKLILSGLDDLDGDLPKQTILETGGPKREQGSSDLHKYDEIDTANFGVPMARSLMIQPVKCQACGAEHYEHQGICLELHYTNGTKIWRKMELLEAAAYRHLPRNVQYSHMMAIDFCNTCFLVDSITDKLFKDVATKVDVSDLDKEPSCDTQSSSSSTSTEQSTTDQSQQTGKEESLSTRPDPWSRSLPVPLQQVLIPGFIPAVI